MPVKEVRIFDGPFVSSTTRSDAEAELEAMHRTPPPPVGLQSALDLRKWRRLRMECRYNPAVYMDHQIALASSSPMVRIVGDITPAYARLRKETIASANALLVDAGFDVRAVLVMRDPVERLLSHYRWRQDKLDRLGQPRWSEAPEFIIAHANENGMRTLHQYVRLIQALESVFPPERLFVGFFEEFFTDAEQQRLARTLGIDDWAPEFDRRSNASAYSIDIPAVVKFEIRRLYDDAYRDMAEMFGADRLAAAWPNYRL
jgi:hypothetical protein